MNFTPEFLGNEMLWWVGVVEYNKDPTNMGRVKVRVFGYHAQDYKKVPMEKLPWAYTIHPTTSAAMSGVGTSPTGLQVGSWVLGFFMDGRKGQYPVVLGTWHGIHGTQNIPSTGAGKGPASKPQGEGENNGPIGNPGGSGDGGGNIVRGDGNANWAPGNTGNLTTIRSQSGASFQVDKSVAGNFQGFINGLEARGVNIIPNQSGGYNYRTIAGSGRLSQHAYGNAIDINWNQNSQGAYNYTGLGNLSRQEVSKLAADNGLSWGGNWRTPDNMHFSYNSNTGIPAVSKVEDLPNYKDPSSSPGTIPDPETDQQHDHGQMENNADQSHSPPADSRSNDDQSPSKNEEIENQHSNDEKDIEGADGTKWGLPCPPDISDYPNQTTQRDPSGNLISMSHHKGGERIMMQHGKSKSYMEIDSNGNMVNRSHGDAISHSARNMRMSADNHFEVATRNGAIRMYSPDRMSLETKGALNLGSQRGISFSGHGDMTIAVGGTLTIDAASIKLVSGTGSIDMRSNDGINMEANGEMNMSAKGNISMESAAAMFQKAHGDWTAHASGKGVLGSDGDMSLKSDNKVKVEGSEYHNKSPKAIFDKGTFKKLYAETLSWDKTSSTAKYAESSGTVPDGTAENLGDPDAADKPLDNVNKRNKELTEASENGEQTKGAGTDYGQKQKGGVARRAEANPIVPNPRPTPNNEQSKASNEETPKPRPCYKDKQHQQKDSAPATPQGGGDSGANGSDPGSSSGGGGYDPTVTNDTNQASLGAASVPAVAKTRPMVIPNIGDSNQPPEKQHKPGGHVHADDSDVEGVRKSGQTGGNMPKVVAASAVMAKYMEGNNKPKTSKLLTSYAPGADPKMQGGFITSRPGLDGKYLPRTLEDYAAGRSSYVTGAMDSSYYGRSFTIPSLSFTGRDGKSQTLQNVPVYVHDTGSAFSGNPNKLDIATADGRGMGYGGAMAFTSQQPFSKKQTEIFIDKPDADTSYTNRVAKVQNAARVYEAAAGQRAPAAIAAATSLYGPNVAHAFGSAKQKNTFNKSINWHLKNTKGREQQGWQEFIKKFKGRLQNPSYSPQELLGLWINSFGAPWKGLAQSPMEYMQQFAGKDIAGLLNGKIPMNIPSLLQSLINKNMGKSSGGGGSSDSSGGSNTETSTSNVVSNTSLISSEYEYNEIDGDDATTTIKMLKVLYGLDPDDELWDRNTFSILTDEEKLADPSSDLLVDSEESHDYS